MRAFFHRVLSHRFGLVALLVFLFCFIGLATRLVLMGVSVASGGVSGWYIFEVVPLGLLFDLVTAGYFIIPILLFVWLVPPSLQRPHVSVALDYALVFMCVVFLLALAVGEWFFWDEFGARFNFIAVDYLVYTTEVVGNIWESYPLVPIAGAILFLAIGIVYAVRKPLRQFARYSLSFPQRTAWALGLMVWPLLSFVLVDSSFKHVNANTYVNELLGNGLYDLFAAYRNNELDYDQFYESVDHEAAFRQVRDLLKTSDAEFLSPAMADIERAIVADGPEHRWNVVMISVESLSADYLAAFGNQQGVTPFLDSLANHSMFFTRLYATGTRTVRGLEALSLCIPPTPGQSIVRRPHNEFLFSMGKVFDSKGYASKYVYGGYGYFDNMNYFFGHNGYEVKDRSSLADDEVTHENIWGVADENLFTLAEREIENTLAAGKPAFTHIMTTSNHRPFTYPEGRIDIPSHTSREGAVKYTDYAIGRFIRQCSSKPWFNNTVFVIVADHCALSAGKTSLPINKYHIPLLIYAPALIPAQRVDRLMSQIDVGPTVLGLLNFSYHSKFFGYDIFRLEHGRERVFLSTYQHLGFIRGNKLVVLKPQRSIETFEIIDFEQNVVRPIPADKELVNEAIAWYEVAAFEFKAGLYR